MTNPETALDALWAPESVAIVGASADPTKPGGRPVAYLSKHGFHGDIWPVNPRVDEIAGRPCFASVADLPGAPDVAIVLLGVARAEAAVRDLAAKGCKVAIVLASGFGEAGDEGRARQDALREAAGDKMRLLGPNTIGAMDLSKGIVLSASGALECDDIPRGGISVASQSGGILGALLSRGSAGGIGFCKLASTGNEADLDIADFIAAYAADEATTVIAAYIEGIRSVDKFRAAAESARCAGKPLVIYKVGRSESGARAAVSHTGAMAGEDRAYDALFRQVGAIRARTFSDLLDLPAMLASCRTMCGNRVAILTSTGGAGSLVADNCGILGLDVPELDPATGKTLADLLGQDQPMTGNPVDVTLAGVEPTIMTAATEALLRSDGIDAVAVVVGSSALARPDVAAGAIRAGAAASNKPLIAYVSPHAPHILDLLNREGVPAFSAPEACATVLKGALPMPPAGRLLRPGSAVVPAGLPNGTLNEAEARALFDAFGLTGAKSFVVQTADEAAMAAGELDGPVVLKVLSREIAHKSDVGGVRVGLAPEAAGAALTAMAERLAAQELPKPEGYLVQAMVHGGIEMILGLRQDPQLGLLILLGAGGVQAELSNDSTLRLLPLREGEAREMVNELTITRLLEGYRGAPAHDIDALIEAIEALACMGDALGDRLLEAEINPIFVLEDGQGVAAADGLVVLGP
ncbi:6-carboxyhexanoate--CoA ligase [Roseivivax halodurans JCM 10272]|uniref:6-carboxyhexanoate--CoA ligase n=1 Tax=Roseivivax halodurans JCM 10272 TaxID=1449350 RepID=X7EBT1_9RHOB|nr:acetate--CoA ligase family protein [Roseivivax halodurans]ETX13377.1 6-carboxyhexanoate--CoA ligase [Roseivivax halodurans JCM 10272]